MAIVLRNMRRLANLPHTDPRRKAAQRRLPVLVMELFKQSVVLGLEYPGAFTDLIGQFNLAISAFSKKGGK
jgi:hypothetical protein